MTAEPVAVEGGSERRSSGFWVILTIFLLSGALGLVAFYRFTASDRFLQRSLAEMKKQAAGLGVEACVDQVLSWSRRCSAMRTLCEASVPRMMEACLHDSDRSRYCRELGQRHLATNFGVPECKARAAVKEREQKKVCALSYRAIASHCERLRLRQQSAGRGAR